MQTLHSGLVLLVEALALTGMERTCWQSFQTVNGFQGTLCNRGTSGYMGPTVRR